MKLILTREVSGLGGAGDVVTVKDGYGRNFLLARGSAIMWTKGGEGQIEGPKAQPNGVADGQQVDIPVPTRIVME